MTITRHPSANWKPEDRLGYVIDSQELENFTFSLRVSHAHRIACLLRSVASLLDELADREIEETDLQLIRQVAREENHKQFRKLITKILDAIRHGGEKGRRAAKLTITRYQEILLDEPLSSSNDLRSTIIPYDMSRRD
jgi:hypothetical protein